MERLRKRPAFLEAAKGRRWTTPSLVLQARRREDDGPVRVGFTTSRKIGKAVSRNRARRRLKAAAERVIPERGKPGYDYVLIGRRETLSREFAGIIEDLATALERVHNGRHTPRRRDGPPDGPSSSAAAAG